jgi:hypothetical protein
MLISVVSEECMSFLYIDTLGGDLVQGMWLYVTVDLASNLWKFIMFIQMLKLVDTVKAGKKTWL